MPQDRAVASFLLIAGVVAGSAALFAYAGGFLSPQRLSPTRIVDALGRPKPDERGHRRNHAKGICFTGYLQSNGQAASLSDAAILARGTSPVIGRFNLGNPDFGVADGKVRVRGIGLDVRPRMPGEWRSAMINAPFFPVATPADFYRLLGAAASKDPAAMKQFAAQHARFPAFGAWAKNGIWTGSYAEERYNSIDSFRFVAADGQSHAVRWSLLPQAAIQPVTPDALLAAGPDVLEREIAERVKSGPLRWTLQITVAAQGDQTADPSQPWPDDRRTVDAGTLVVDRIVDEADGPCRDINFDPTILPNGIGLTDDPFPAARSAAYAVSFNRRTAEEADYPRHPAKGDGR